MLPEVFLRGFFWETASGFILDSVLCRTFLDEFHTFHGEDGLVPEVDSGYTLMRQSTVTFGRIPHIFLMKVDSDPVHKLSG